MVQEMPARITGTSPDVVSLTSLSLHDIQDEQVEVTQTVTFTDPNEVVRQFNEYWLPIWQS